MQSVSRKPTNFERKPRVLRHLCMCSMPRKDMCCFPLKASDVQLRGHFTAPTKQKNQRAHLCQSCRAPDLGRPLPNLALDFAKTPNRRRRVRTPRQRLWIIKTTSWKPSGHIHESAGNRMKTGAYAHKSFLFLKLRRASIPLTQPAGGKLA